MIESLINNRLKFRAWDGHKFTYSEEYPSLEKFFAITDDAGYGDFRTIYQQFTGLLLENGKEIYEGDIVFAAYTWPLDDKEREEDKETFEVVWRNTKHGGKSGWELERIKDKDCQFYGEWPDLQFVEAIGNIFETPEFSNK